MQLNYQKYYAPYLQALVQPRHTTH